MIMKMIQDPGERMEAKIEKMQVMLTKDLQELKNRQTEKNNTLEGINSRITEVEEQINDWKTECWKLLLKNRKKTEKK